MFEGIPLEDVKKIVGAVVSDPTYFWPIFWWYLEILSLTDLDGFKKTLEIRKNKLPCHECREHLQFKLTQVDSSMEAFDYVVALHNVANNFKAKEEYTPLQRLEEIYLSTNIPQRK